MIRLICKRCGKEFLSDKSSTTYCSRECYSAAAKDRGFASLKAKLATEVRTCRICGASFTPKAGNQVCCSPECTTENRKRASRELHIKKNYHKKPGKPENPNKKDAKARLKHQQDRDVWGHDPNEYARMQIAKTLAMLPKIGERV